MACKCVQMSYDILYQIDVIQYYTPYLDRVLYIYYIDKASPSGVQESCDLNKFCFHGLSDARRGLESQQCLEHVWKMDS